jgi:hypothetical protein
MQEAQPISNALKTQVGGSHYKGMKIQHVEFVHANGIPYIEANAIKYICRHRQKNGRQDIEKAIHYLQILLDLEYPQPVVEPQEVFKP